MIHSDEVLLKSSTIEAHARREAYALQLLRAAEGGLREALKKSYPEREELNKIFDCVVGARNTLKSAGGLVAEDIRFEKSRRFDERSVRFAFKEPIPEDFEWLEDVNRISDIYARRGFTLSRKDAYHAWKQYSDGLAASWMVLPKEEDEVFSRVAKFVEFGF